MDSTNFRGRSTRRVDDTADSGVERIAERLEIIGGGVIGQEFAQFPLSGSRVTVVEVLDRILSEVDAELHVGMPVSFPAGGQDPNSQPRSRLSKKAGTFSGWFTRKEVKRRSAKLTGS